MKVLLTKLSLDETKNVHLLWSDEEATLFTNFPYLATLEECQQRLIKMMTYYGQREDHFGPFVIRNQTGEFLGLTGGDAGAIPGEFEIWYFVRRDYWGKHIATSAVTQLLERMKQSGKVSKIKATAVVHNEPSWRFLTKLGFERTGTLPNAHKKNEKTWDLYVYSKEMA